MATLKKNFKYLFIAIGVIFIWRGVWGLADIYLIPDNQTQSFIVSVIIGIVILLLINWRKVDIGELDDK